MQLQLKERITRATWRDWMAVGVLAALAFLIFVWLDPRKCPHYTFVFGALCIGFTGFIFGQPTIRKDIGFRLMTAFAVWALVVCNKYLLSWEESPLLFTYFLAMTADFFLLYPLAVVLPKEKTLFYLTLFATVYFVVLTVISAMGIYCALFDKVIPSVDDAYYTAMSYRISWRRLELFCWPTVGAAYCSIALMLGFYLILQAKRVWLRTCYICASVVIFIALALTDGRTAYTLFAVCAGGFVYLLAENPLSRSKIKKRSHQFILSVGFAVITTAVVFLSTRLVTKSVNAVAERIASQSAATTSSVDPATQTVSLKTAPLSVQSRLVPVTVQTASAEPTTPVGNGEDATDPVTSRSLLEKASSLNGRTQIWMAAIQMLHEHPVFLLTGTTPLFVARYVRSYFANADFSHLHSIYFQTLVAYGVPGLILLLGIMGYFLFHALRLFFCGNGHCTLAQRTLPLVLFFFTALDTMEIFTRFQAPNDFGNFWFYLIGGYVVYLSKTYLSDKRLNGEAMLATTEQTEVPCP